MRIKKFEAPTLVAALHQVKMELGPEAVILETQKLHKGGFLGLRKKETIQVTAAVDLNMLEKNVKVNPSNGDDQRQEEMEKEFEKRFTLLQRQLSDVSQMIMDLKHHVAAPSQDGLTPALNALYQHLILNQLEAGLAMSVVEEINEMGVEGYPGTKEAAISVISGKIPMTSPVSLEGKKPRVVALIGPTGVGKTTTIAKLAARFGLVEEKKIALITADTYRIAAVDQLKVYAEIMDIPLEVVFTPGQMKPALARHSDKDLVFIDTAGRSPQAEKQLEELEAFLKAAKPHETHMVMSANTKGEDLDSALSSFGRSRLDKIIFTKLDETLTLGTMINALIGKGLPLSYITNGQNVPDDIATYDPQRLASMLVSGWEENRE